MTKPVTMSIGLLTGHSGAATVLQTLSKEPQIGPVPLLSSILPCHHIHRLCSAQRSVWQRDGECFNYASVKSLLGKSRAGVGSAH